MKNWKRWLAILLVGMMAALPLSGCKQPKEQEPPAETETLQSAEGTPKYIFLFIGDGMSYAQVEAAALYLGSQKAGISSDHLSFMDFDVTGCVETYDETSYIPDSASSGTAIATGHITSDAAIGMDASGQTSFPSIAERLKEEKGFKIGIVSTVYLNHATPAVFYAHQKSRNMYYEIGLDLIESGFDYFGGGGLYDTNNGDTSEDLYTLAEAAGYAVANTLQEAGELSSADGKAIVVAPPVDEDTITVPYQMDATETDWSLADYVSKGIEMIDNDVGFFMMVESGKIDWACHANDSNATVSEVLALSDAVQIAAEFYNEHPEETLILVTGDHETGGMSLGNAEKEYILYPQYLQKQTVSFTKFNDDYIMKYKEEKTPFESVLVDIEIVFGLVASKNAKSGTDPNLIMTKAEVDLLQTAYGKTLEDTQTRTADEDLLYSTYEPLTITANHILNSHIGIGYSSYVHTAAPLPVYAHGARAQSFAGVYHTTGIYNRLAVIFGISNTE